MPQYILNSAAKTVIDIDGTSYLFFGGTNYLGLGYHPDIIMAAQEGLIRWGLNTAGSRPTTAGVRIHLKLEDKIREFLNCEDVITSCGGYLSDLQVVQAIADDFDICVMDENTHVSVKDAVASKAMIVRHFKHREPNSLEDELKKLSKAGKSCLVCTDTVFPTSGLLAPLNKYDELASRYGATILTNDAHGLGVLGENGKGTLNYFGLGFDNIILNGSMSKALGCFGGFSAGNKPLEENIRTRSNVFIGATPLPPAIAEAAIVAIDIITRNGNIQAKLQENIKIMRGGLKKIGVEFEDSPMPRVCFSFGDRERNMQIHEKLIAEQILIPYNYYPGGPKDGCFRMIVTARHSDKQITHALEVLERALKTL
jgi:7-keto-8-aminopelargonate synthetase-like enzyme